MDYEVARRDGPSVQDYIDKFIEFLYRRTGFEFQHFESPRYLQRLLDELSYNKVPLSVWQSLMTAVLRITNMNPNIEHRFRHFGALFADALVWFLRRLMKMGLVRFCIFLCAWNLHPVIAGVIGIIFYLVDYCLDELFARLSTFIQSRLISAPYYKHFLGAV